jgi:hypothetical protein
MGVAFEISGCSCLKISVATDILNMRIGLCRCLATDRYIERGHWMLCCNVEVEQYLVFGTGGRILGINVIV